MFAEENVENKVGKTITILNEATTKYIAKQQKENK